MSKETKHRLDDKYFFDNGYWYYGEEEVIQKSEKWRILMDVCFDKIKSEVLIDGKAMKVIKLITPEVIQEVIDTWNSGTQRKKRTSHYKKKIRPEGYLNVAERTAFKRKNTEIRKARHVDRNTQ